MSEIEQKDKITSSLKDLSTSIQNQVQNQTQLQNTLSELQKAVTDFKKDFAFFRQSSQEKMQDMTLELKTLTNAFTPNVKDLDDIPGVRTPKWYQGTIPFDYGDSAEKFVSIDINPEGPFVITKITPLWAVGDGFTILGGNDYKYFTNSTPPAPLPTLSTVASNRILPCSAYPIVCQNFGYTNTETTGYSDPSLAKLFYRNPNIVGGSTSTWGALSDIPEMFFQIEIVGAGRFWTTQAISAAAFYGCFGYPLYTGVLGWVERGDRISIRAVPSVPAPHVGRVLFILEGFQILGDVNISKELGY